MFHNQRSPLDAGTLNRHDLRRMVGGGGMRLKIGNRHSPTFCLFHLMCQTLEFEAIPLKARPLGKLGTLR